MSYFSLFLLSFHFQLIFILNLAAFPVEIEEESKVEAGFKENESEFDEDFDEEELGKFFIKLILFINKTY